eukprot:8921502-Pyramimonas_sp.AAC.1
MALLPKSVQDERAVSKCSTLYRMYARMRGDQIHEWTVAHTDFWDSAVRNSSALQAALLRELCHEVAGALSFESASLHWDMEKFFDSA